MYKCQKLYYFTVPCGYLKHEKSGCLPGNDLHSMTSDGTPHHDNCVEWCNNNINCGGFTVFRRSTCYFKSWECGNDIINKTYVVLYLKRGIIWSVFTSKLFFLITGTCREKGHRKLAFLFKKLSFPALQILKTPK